jgi:hypothetical protein
MLKNRGLKFHGKHGRTNFYVFFYISATELSPARLARLILGTLQISKYKYGLKRSALSIP